MKFTFKLNNHKYYDCLDNISPPLDMLYLFLHDEIGGGQREDFSWRDFLSNPKENEMFGNISYLRKENNYAYIGFFCGSEDIYPYPGEEKFLISELIKAITAWIEVKKSKPLFITVELEGERILVYASES